MFVSTDLFLDEDYSPLDNNLKNERNQKPEADIYKSQPATESILLRRHSHNNRIVEISSNIAKNPDISTTVSTMRPNIVSMPKNFSNKHSTHDLLFGLQDRPTEADLNMLSMSSNKKEGPKSRIDSIDIRPVRKSLAFPDDNQDDQNMINQQSNTNTLTSLRGNVGMEQIQNALQKQKQRLLDQQRHSDIGTIRYYEFKNYKFRPENSPLYYKANEKFSPTEIEAPSNFYQSKKESHHVISKSNTDDDSEVDQSKGDSKNQQTNQKHPNGTGVRRDGELNRSSENSDKDHKVEETDDSQFLGLENNEFEKKQSENDVEAILTTNDPKINEMNQTKLFDCEPESVSLVRLLESVGLKNFLMQPAQKNRIIKCTIKQYRSGLARFFNKYYIYLTNESRFLMAAKKRAGNKTSNYGITMSSTDFNKKTTNYLGKLRSNFTRSEFNIWDHGLNPKNAQSLEKLREQLGVILYEQNSLGKKNGRNMRVLLPAINSSGGRACIKPISSKEGMLTSFTAGKTEGIDVYTNKQREDSKNYDNMHFQLVSSKDENQILFQFVKVGDDAFSMEFQWPLSPFQAFAICLSIFDSRVECK